MKGNCKNGSACRFSHDFQSSPNLAPLKSPSPEKENGSDEDAGRPAGPGPVEGQVLIAVKKEPQAEGDAALHQAPVQPPVFYPPPLPSVADVRAAVLGNAKSSDLKAIAIVKKEVKEEALASSRGSKPAASAFESIMRSTIVEGMKELSPDSQRPAPLPAKR